jgi:parvulin-like peptidyl-prolyl isomerase
MSFSCPINRVTVFLIVTVFLSTGMWACSSEKEKQEEILASVGDFEITRTHYLNELRRFYDRTGQAVNLGSDVMENVLNSRVNRYTVVELAYSKGWHAEPEAQHLKSMIRRKVNMEEYERRFIHDEVEISEQDLRELFYRANTSVRASHIYARYRHEADSLYNLIEQGYDFTKLAKSVFRNEELAQSGGDLGFFTIDDMDVSFEQQAFRMEIGDISKPVRTSRGYSIIKVTDIVTTPVITETEFANKRHEIAAIARNQLFEIATREHMRQVIDGFNFNENLIRSLWEAVQNQPDAYFSFNDEANMLTLDIPQNELNEALGVKSDFTFTTEDFMRESHFSSLEERARASDLNSFREQVQGLAFRAYALSKVAAHPGYNESYVERTIEETFFNYLNERFDNYLDTLVEVPEELIEIEYHSNRDLYVKPIELNLAEIVTTNEDRANSAWEKLENGASFDSVLQQYTVDSSARLNNGELGMMPIDRFGMLSPSLNHIQPGEYAGPFQIMSNRFVIFKCLERVEPQPLSFEEAKPVIKRYLHDTVKSHVRASVLGEAREKFNATIFTERLHAIPIQL